MTIPARTLARDLRALSILSRSGHGAAAVLPAANARLRAALEAKMTPYDKILTTTRQIVANHIGLATCDVGEDAILADLGVDSFDLIQVVLDLEAAMSIDIPDDDLDALTTVKALAQSAAKARGISNP